MIRFVTIALLILSSHSAYANCELSWVKGWELNQNWFHTAATYATQKNRMPIPTVIQALYKTELNEIEVRCMGASIDSCHKITRIRNRHTSCDVRPNEVKSIKGKESEMGLVLYARERFDNCLKGDIESDIGVLTEKSVLALPDTHQLVKLKTTEANKLFEQVERSIRALPELKKIKYHSQNPEIDVSQANLNLTEVLQDSSGNMVITLSATLKLADIANIEKANNSLDTVTLPLVVSKINNNWLLIGNGYVGQCSSYSDKGARTMIEQLQLNYGLPTSYQFYDLDYDGKIDILEFTPRKHLPGTKYIYHIQKNKLILIGELCTTAPEQCRPGAGC